MKFKLIRNLIFSPLEIIIDDKHIENVNTQDPDIDIYNNYEVIGIRADVEHIFYDTFEDAEGKVVVSLKEPLSANEPLGNPYHEPKIKGTSLECKE